MSAPTPGWPPQPAPKRKVPTGRILALALLAVIVFCVGGVATIGAILGPSEPSATKPATEGQAQPALAAPTSPEPPAESPAEPPAEPPAESPSEVGTTAPPATPAAKPTTEPAAALTSTKPKPRSTTTKPTTRAPQPKPTTKKPKPKPKPTTKPPAKTVTPGAFCSPEGATGVSKKGKLYRCTRKAGEDRARWRAA